MDTQTAFSLLSSMLGTTPSGEVVGVVGVCILDLVVILDAVVVLFVIVVVVVVVA